MTWHQFENVQLSQKMWRSVFFHPSTITDNGTSGTSVPVKKQTNCWHRWSYEDVSKGFRFLFRFLSFFYLWKSLKRDSADLCKWQIFLDRRSTRICTWYATWLLLCRKIPGALLEWCTSIGTKWYCIESITTENYLSNTQIYNGWDKAKGKVQNKSPMPRVHRHMNAH